MAKKSDELLNQCLEIEGLLALISKREDNTPLMVYEMLRDKTAELSASVAGLCVDSGVVAESQPETCVSERADEAAIGDAAEAEEMADADIDENPGTELPVEAELQLPPVVDTYESNTDTEYNPEIFSESTEDEDNAVVVESEMVAFDPVVVDYETVVAAETPMLEAVQGAESALPPAEEPFELPQPESATREASVETVDYEDDAQQPVLSDKFAEFTLNDKFRFRRELFGNSDIDMNEALDVVNAMSSREEVEDYFYNDMCWDPANDDVKDFMRIVTAKFN